MKHLFRKIIGEVGVNIGQEMLIPVTPITIKITKIRKDGVVYARLVSNGETIMNASLDHISKRLSDLPKTP